MRFKKMEIEGRRLNPEYGSALEQNLFSRRVRKHNGIFSVPLNSEEIPVEQISATGLMIEWRKSLP